ncbi:hypothetical protein ACHAWT_000730 [Skeletonema menzelii]
MTSALTVALAATSLATLASGFTPPSSTAVAAAATAVSYKTALYQELPFFAAPAFTSSTTPSTATSSSGTISQSSPPQSATVTLRLPLGTLFDGRDYIFVTESNVRGYEWTEKETDILLDDLMDAALGTLGGQDTTTNNPQQQQQQQIITDYELSQIVLVPTSDWDSNLLGLGSRYDVYDGQQRLVTLNLLLASLRDSFQLEASSSSSTSSLDGGGGNNKRSVALKATANEISSMLLPRKVRKEDVKRITLRKRDNVLLEKILVHNLDHEDEDDDEQQQQEEEDSTTKAATLPPSNTWSKLSPKQKSTLLTPLSNANTRIFHNFIHLTKRLSLLTTRERLRLLDYIVERVYLLVCIPETSRIARNIVMSQGRKGMDNEAVDDFKGLVCFRYTLDEDDMYQTFDQWDELAAEPTTSISSSSSSITNDSSSSPPSLSSSKPIAVGRDIITSACLLRASAALRTKIRSRGGDEVYEWERWLRQELWLQNQLLAKKQQQQDNNSKSTTDPLQPWQGKDFFANKIQPASIVLHKFRTRQWDEFTFLSKDVNKKMTKMERSAVIARFDFLRDVIMGVTSAKEAEIVVLDILLRAEEAAMSNGGGSGLDRYLEKFLPLVESWTLWMALTRPSPMQRHARVFSLLDAMDDVDSVGAGIFADDDEMENVKAAMDEYEFGASAGGKRLAAAILKRMSTHLMLEEKKGIPDGGDVSVDFILPSKFAKGSEWEKQWPEEEERVEWMNRIGNLALVSSRPRSRTAKKKGADSSWEQKCVNFKKEPWLLTRQLIELDGWDAAAVQDQQKDILSLTDLVWSFGTKE